LTSAQVDIRKLSAARLWAAARLPYLANALFACGIRAAPETDTIAIDRSWQLQVDPAVLATMSVEQLGRLVVHLCGHVIRDHASRAQQLGIDAANARGRWNRCADAEINDDLEADDCVPDVAPDRPAGLGCETGQLAEHYYAQAGDGPRHWDCGSGADACLRPGDCQGGLSLEQGALLRIATAAEIQRHGREPGTVAAGWLRWAESILPSKVDWRRVLAAEIRRGITAVAGKVDYSYRRPPRRGHLHGDVVLPTLVRPLPEVAIVCDTSGSMHDRLLARALTEVEGILERAGLRRANVRVLAVDAAVHTVRRVTRATQVELAGGGGTDMGAGISAAAGLRPRPSIVIVLTDGFTPWPERPPAGIRVIVGLLRELSLPMEWQPPAWARTVEIDDQALAA
jgi:predicted metal-dependent peptidase